jgi:phage host-nuclease inhibitor protein Gam
MASKRLKPTTSINSRAEFDSTVDDIVILQNELNAQISIRDTRIQEIQSEHNPAIEDLKRRIQDSLHQAEAYADSHRLSLFSPGYKTARTPLAEFGFRTGQPTLKTLPKITWARVLDRLQAAVDRGGKWTKLVRTKAEPDKEAIRANLDAGELAEVGLYVDQAEAFWVEPKTEDPQRMTA